MPGISSDGSWNLRVHGFVLNKEIRKQTSIMTITPILFIGPVRAGKSTLASLVARRLNLSHISLDEVRWKYYREIGYDEDLAK